MRTRFGMLMTDAVGKAGGQCIQRRGNTRVLRNISIPTQRLASTQNPQRFTANFLFSIWATLDQATRDEWAYIGSTLRGLDTFGNEKNFTAREAFLKCNAVYYNYQKALISPFGFNFSVPSLAIGVMTLRFASSALDIHYVTSDNGEAVQMKAMQLRNVATNPTSDKLKTFHFSNAYTESDANYAALLKMFPSMAVGSIFSIAVRIVSTSGLVSPWIQQQVVCIL